MSIPFGFSLPSGDPNDPQNNPLAGLGDMLQSLGRMLSESQGMTEVTGAGIIAAAKSAAAPAAASITDGSSTSAITGLSAMCAPWIDSATALAPTPADL